MTRKQPVLLLLFLGIVVAYVIHSRNLQYLAYKDAFEQDVLVREGRIDRFVAELRETGQKGYLDVLHQRAETLRLADVVDFYVLHDRGSVLWFGTTNVAVSVFEKQPDKLEDYVVEKETSTYSVDLGDGLVLTLGLHKDFNSWFQKNYPRSEQWFRQDLFVVAFLVLVVGAWSLRDIRSLFANLRKGDMIALSKMKSQSQETELFLRGFSGFAQSVDELQNANELLGRQILPSLKKEIFSGKQPPYDFNCTLVRVDINNFSTIYNSQDVTQFMNVVNEFFVGVSHVVTRYRGLVHEFVGDEVIIYFKDEDHPSSFLIAVSALRDINSLATKFNERTLAESAYPFTVKSSLAYGRVRFGPLVNGYTVAGSVLIETVRILSQVHEKDGNVIFFDHSNVERLGSFIKWRPSSKVTLKGFTGERLLCAYESHRSLTDVLAALQTDGVNWLDFYRCDADILQVLTYLRDHSSHLHDDVVLKALNRLREFNMSDSHFDFADFLLTWSENLTADPAAHNDRSKMKLASSVVKLMISLVEKKKFGTSAAQRLKNLVRVSDRRVVANTLEVLSHFDIEQDSVVARAVQNSSDTRVVANALVHEGRAKMTGSIYRRLRGMLKSGSPEAVASALYALGEIAAFHRKQDYVYFSTQVKLQALLEELPEYLKSGDPSVRRQAVIAAMRLGEPKILEKVEQLVTASPKLEAELREFLADSIKAA